MSSAVRCLMNTGLPLHLMTTFLPSGMLLISTSTLAKASTSAEADIVLEEKKREKRKEK